MKTFKSILEAKTNTVVFFFGRCNPPTPAHVLLFNIVVQTAKKLGADYKIVISRTQDKKNNPLNISQKLEFLKAQAPNIEFTAASENSRTPIEVLKLFNGKYKNVVLIAGSDRVDAFQTLFDQYNGKEYNFESIKVISGGERDPDSDDITGMSGTKMREAAIEGDFKKFKKFLMPSVREIDGKRFMNNIRVALNLPIIKESIKFNTTEIREKFYRGEIFNEGDFVESNNVIYKIINKNSNYLTLVDENGILSKKWLTDVTECTVPEEVKIKFGEIKEMKFNSNDKLKVAKIIGASIGVDVENKSNPEQIVNMALRKLKSKDIRGVAHDLLQRMLQTADDAGIEYDKTILGSKVEESADKIDEVLTVDMGIDKWIKDFVNSNAPQFNGKSKEERRKMAIAAFMSAKKKNESIDNVDEIPEDGVEDYNEWIKKQVEIYHARGERFITPFKEHQVIADAYHAALNLQGGQQVDIPHGHSLAAPADTALGKMKINYMRGESVESEDDFEFDDDDIDDLVNSIKDEDMYDAYDDEELHIVDSDTGESQGTLKDFLAKDRTNEEAEQINEVLSRLERIKAAMRMRIRHAGMERKLKLALKRRSNTKRLISRAKKLAIKTIKAKIIKKPISQFTIQDKERIEKIIKTKQSLINRIALKLMPKIRKLEQTRLSHPTFTKEQE